MNFNRDVTSMFQRTPTSSEFGETASVTVPDLIRLLDVEIRKGLFCLVILKKKNITDDAALRQKQVGNFSLYGYISEFYSFVAFDSRAFQNDAQ